MVDYDLHIHSNFSDGIFTPKEIFEKAKFLNLKGIAITDHDTISACEASLKLSSIYNIEYVPGIELTSFLDNTEVHILGYFIDYKDEVFIRFINNLNEQRNSRIHRMLEILKNLDYSISLEEITNKNKQANITALGRPHIARLLVEKGYFASTNEAFEKLLVEGKPAFVAHFKLDAAVSINAIKAAKGIPIVAHPMLVKKYDQYYKYDYQLNKLISLGLSGVEVFHTSHNIEEEKYLYNFCSKNNLLITGGSDCHGDLSYKNKLLLGSKGIDQKTFDKICNLKSI